RKYMGSYHISWLQNIGSSVNRQLAITYTQSVRVDYLGETYSLLRRLIHILLALADLLEGKLPFALYMYTVHYLSSTGVIHLGEAVSMNLLCLLKKLDQECYL
ncbi:unnamed protein product, partial [Meganyctiphanes norvegica]